MTTTQMDKNQRDYNDIGLQITDRKDPRISTCRNCTIGEKNVLAVMTCSR